MKTTAVAAAAAPIDGLSKQEAAGLLECSVRNVERLAAAGQIRKITLPKAPGEKTAPVVYDRRDLEAVKRGETEAKPATVVGGSKAQTTIVNAGAAEFVAHVAAALALPPAEPPKPWLSISEAAAFSGLPAAFLRARAPELARAGAAVNVATGSRPRWRILRKNLESAFPVSASAGD